MSLDSLDLTEAPRKDSMSLSRDSGLTLSDCQLFIPESPVGSEDSVMNVSSCSNNYDKPLTKEDKTNGKSYVPVYYGWEERLNGYASPGGHSSTENSFREEKINASYPNPNFQRQDWLRAQLKRTSRTNKLDEQEHRKETQRFGDKENVHHSAIYNTEYLRQGMKENVENCKAYRNRQLNVSYDSVLSENFEKSSQQDIRGNERVSIHDSEQDLTGGSDRSGSSPVGSDCYEKDDYSDYQKEKEVFNEYKNVSCTFGCQYPVATQETPEQKTARCLVHHPNLCEYEMMQHMYMDIYKNEEYYKFYKSEESTRSEYERSDVNDPYKDRVVPVVDLNEDDQEKEKKIPWPDIPPPLPPRLRHLPPVHMNLEDRHKVASRSKSLPPPPPYRPPPQPRAPITTRHLNRSIVDDESYV